MRTRRHGELPVITVAPFGLRYLFEGPFRDPQRWYAETPERLAARYRKCRCGQIRHGHSALITKSRPVDDAHARTAWPFRQYQRCNALLITSSNIPA